MNDTEETFMIAFVVVSVFSLIMLCVLGGLHLGDARDDVNVREFGTLLCESKGLEYSHRTWLDDGTNVLTRVPVIHCTQTKTVPLMDGVVVIG